MSTIRMLSRPIALLGLLAAGVPVLGALLATPAAAFCLGGCGFRFNGGASSPMFARRPMMPSAALSANRSVVRLHEPRRVPSTATVSTTTAAARVMRARSLASASAGTTTGASKRPHTGASHLHSRVTKVATGDAQPGGPSIAATQTSSFSQGGAAGGFHVGTPGGSGPSGPGALADTSAGGVKSLNGLGSNRASSGGPGAASSQTTPNTRTTTILKAVTVCMTPAGSCPMERDVGTACQCQDMQGNVYDGIVK
jgi:hypothetical protein